MHISFRRFLRNVLRHCLPPPQNQVLLTSGSAGLPSHALQSLVHRLRSAPEIRQLLFFHLLLFCSFLPLPYLHGHRPSVLYTFHHRCLLLDSHFYFNTASRSAIRSSAPSIPTESLKIRSVIPFRSSSSLERSACVCVIG